VRQGDDRGIDQRHDDDSARHGIEGEVKHGQVIRGLD
jgi:hypothetical protein